MKFSLFGKKKKAKAPKKANPETTLQAISQLDKTMAQLEKRRTLLEKRSTGFVKKAKQEVAKGNKKGALFALKQKKMYEKQIVNLDNSILRLTEQKMVLESAAMTKTVVETMATGSRAMKEVHKDMDIDQVEDLKDEIQDAMADVDDINDAIATPFGDVMDEDEIEDELNDLMLDDDPIETAAAPTPFLPDVPQQVCLQSVARTSTYFFQPA